MAVTKTTSTTSKVTAPTTAPINASHELDASYTSSEWLLTIVCTLFAVSLVYLASRKIERNRGRVWKYHAIYWTSCTALVLLLPNNIERVVFSKVAVMVVGTVYPIYESIRAITTVTVEDDKSWLQFWTAQAVIAFTTAWFDDYKFVSAAFIFRWRVFEFVYFLWLALPFTDGAALCFDYITEPYIAPHVAPVAEQAGNFLTTLIQMFANITHLVIAWVFFVILPAALKRFLVILLGVSYPLLASIVAVTTERDDDDTFWLTYWSGYGLLFLLMDFLEEYIGWFPGFYSIFLLSTLYLMLPMFSGAEKLFRHALVPVFGLRKMLLVGDALRVKKEMLRQLPPDQIVALREQIAISFAEDDSDVPDYLQPKARGTTLGITRGALSFRGGSVRPGGYGAVASKEDV